MNRSITAPIVLALYLGIEACNGTSMTTAGTGGGGSLGGTMSTGGNKFTGGVTGTTVTTSTGGNATSGGTSSRGGSTNTKLVAKAVTAGYAHACALLTGGGVQCWGYNVHGQLGNGTVTDSSPLGILTPVTVSGITDATFVTAGYDHTCAVLSGGTIQCWGFNFYGELGDGTTTGYSPNSVPVTVSGITNATSASAGTDHTCALLAGGTVQCWGYNFYGELGDGTTTDSSSPVTVSGVSNATAISAGMDHNCALLTAGTIQCWGRNIVGALGNGATTNSSAAVMVSGITNAIAVTAGAGYTCALLADGLVQCWGNNYDGELGNGTTTNSSVPVAVLGLTNATAVAAGGSSTCALLAGGETQCWGNNSYGQLGNGSLGGSFYSPVTASGNANATAVSLGGEYTSEMLTGGTIQCWGYNNYGQLGDGTTTDSLAPVTVSGF